MATYISTAQDAYKKMIEEMQGAKEAAAVLPTEYTSIAEMFKAGGTYGAGQRAILEEQLKKGVALEQAALVASGMSSGTLASAVKGRYARGLATGYQQIEDIRTEKLASALGAVAAAKEARGVRLTGAYQTTAGLLAEMGRVKTEESIANLRERLSLMGTMLSLESLEKRQREEITARKEESATERQFAAEERAKYEVTAPKREEIEKMRLFI